MESAEGFYLYFNTLMILYLMLLYFLISPYQSDHQSHQHHPWHHLRLMNKQFLLYFIITVVLILSPYPCHVL